VIVTAAPALDGSVPPFVVKVATIPSLVEDAIVAVVPLLDISIPPPRG
jgi:hypothetical protein